MPKILRLLPWVEIRKALDRIEQALGQILRNQELIIRLLRDRGLSVEDRAALERAITRLESLAKEN